MWNAGVLEEVGGEYDHVYCTDVWNSQRILFFKKNKVCGGCCRLYVNTVPFCIKDKNTWALACMSGTENHP